MINEMKRFRQSLLLTQIQLGEKLGVHRNMINRYESGKSIPSYKTIRELIKISEIYQKKIDLTAIFTK